LIAIVHRSGRTDEFGIEGTEMALTLGNMRQNVVRGLFVAMALSCGD
jgi:hypothetical protein